MTLFCASPRRLERKTWDVIETRCPDINHDGALRCCSNSADRTSTTWHSFSTESAGDEQKENNCMHISVHKTLLTINGIMLVWSIGGGVFILGRYVKTLRKSLEVPENSLVQLHPVPMCSSIRMPSDSNRNRGYTTGHVYETVM
jgi:hypothetical protein